MKHVAIGLALLVSITPLSASGGSPAGWPPTLLATAGTAIAATETDRAAFARGILSQRAINIFQDPRACGIVLLRATCAAALPPQLASFARTGDRDLIDPKWAEANAVLPPDPARWKADPRDLWLELAGTVYQESYWPERERVLGDLFMIPALRGLATHAVDAGPFQALVPVQLQGHGDTLMVPAAATFFKGLVSDLGLLFPIAADPNVHSGDGLRGDMLRGVYLSTGGEMFESPLLFLSPQSRAFFRDVCNALAENSTDPEGATKARQLGERFLVASGPTEWANLQKQWEESLIVWTVRPFPQPRRDAVLYGIFSAQIAYNAAILRDPKVPVSGQFNALRNFDGADAGFPNLTLLRERILATPSGDWKALNDNATALTLAISKTP